MNNIYNFAAPTIAGDKNIVHVKDGHATQNFLVKNSTASESVLFHTNNNLFLSSILTNPLKVIITLREAIASLRKSIEYTGYHTAFLLGQLSDEEFDDISEQYSIESKEYLSNYDKEKILILSFYSQKPYTSSELSEILQVDKSKIDEFIERLTQKL